MFGDLATELKGREFAILLFPCNQFLGQEPGNPSGDSIKSMSAGKIDMNSLDNVHLFAKVEVNGDNATQTR